MLQGFLHGNGKCFILDLVEFVVWNIKPVLNTNQFVHIQCVSSALDNLLQKEEKVIEDLKTTLKLSGWLLAFKMSLENGW